MDPRDNRSAAALLTALAHRQLSAEILARACLDRAAEVESSLHLFTHLDATAVIAQARALDQGPVRGPLHGLPLGIKDVIDTRDMPTTYGSEIYAGHRPVADAAIVALARQLGAYAFGKTAATEFACMPPAPTRNPRNPAHTPGGSSSGSAAAVACGVLPAAIGTQTGGSVIRPAAFCGVVGYKPTYGWLPRVGAKMISDTLDTLGLFAMTVADAALLGAALASRDSLALPGEVPAPRLAWCRTPQWPLARPETQALFADLPGLLAKKGASAPEVALPPAFDGLEAAHITIADYELVRCLGDEYRNHRARMREPLRAALDQGWTIPSGKYDAALALAAQCRQALPDVLAPFDALLVPSAPGEAPEGLESTGNPAFNKLWTLLQVPAVHVPLRNGPTGLPIGVQVVGRPGDDARVLACAHWVEKNLKQA